MFVFFAFLCGKIGDIFNPVRPGIRDVVYSYDSWVRDVIAPDVLGLAPMNEFAKSIENEVATCFQNC